tara:strand:+ start:9425 stop:9640 length:216 start_codon:yes stop_codon:yes gene_type:complete
MQRWKIVQGNNFPADINWLRAKFFDQQKLSIFCQKYELDGSGCSMRINNTLPYTARIQEERSYKGLKMTWF